MALDGGNITFYGNFKGVDFSQDPSLCDKSRSPFAVNIISDKSGQPEKRVGYRTIFDFLEHVNGIQYGTIKGISFMLVHSGTKLFKFKDGVKTLLKEGLADNRSQIFFFAHKEENKAFIITGKEYLVFDGETVKNVFEIATVPTVFIGKHPNGTGAVAYQSENMLGTKRIERFLSDGKSKEYKLSQKGIKSTGLKITLKNNDTESEIKNFSVNCEKGIIIFSSPPPISSLTGEDNVYIQYEKDNTEELNKIIGCRFFGLFAQGGANRLFFSGNPAFKAWDFKSELNDPCYFPKDGYSIIGNTNFAVMGYLKRDSYMFVLKEESGGDTSIFLRSAEIYDGKTVFKLIPGITGTGACSPNCFVNLIDEPLFLTKNGIYAITSNSVTFERTIQNRSFFVDNRLTKEKNLDSAVATEFNGFYILAINGNAYLLDSRQMTGDGKYECYFWDNINVTCFLTVNKCLYFTDNLGKLYKFNTDIDTMERFSDDGKPIKAVWSTKMDDDGLPNTTKKLLRKGSCITLKPLVRSGFKLLIKTQEDTLPRLIREASVGIFDWHEIDFNDFTFISNDNARTVPINRKVSRYRALQFFVINDRLNQGLGIFNIVKRYSKINFVKR